MFRSHCQNHLFFFLECLGYGIAQRFIDCRVVHWALDNSFRQLVFLRSQSSLFLKFGIGSFPHQWLNTQLETLLFSQEDMVERMYGRKLGRNRTCRESRRITKVRWEPIPQRIQAELVDPREEEKLFVFDIHHTYPSTFSIPLAAVNSPGEICLWLYFILQFSGTLEDRVPGG